MALIKKLQIYPLTSLFLEYTLIVHSDLSLDAVFTEIKSFLNFLMSGIVKCKSLRYIRCVCV